MILSRQKEAAEIYRFHSIESNQKSRLFNWQKADAECTLWPVLIRPVGKGMCVCTASSEPQSSGCREDLDDHWLRANKNLQCDIW